MNWNRWGKTVACSTPGSAFIFLNAYIMALFDRCQIDEATELGLCYAQEGGTSFFFAVDITDSAACLDIPLITVQNVNAGDVALQNFTRVNPSHHHEN